MNNKPVLIPITKVEYSKNGSNYSAILKGVGANFSEVQTAMLKQHVGMSSVSRFVPMTPVLSR